MSAAEELSDKQDQQYWSGCLRGSERPVPEAYKWWPATIWPKVSKGDSGVGVNGYMLPYVAGGHTTVMQGGLIGSWGSPPAPGEAGA